MSETNERKSELSFTIKELGGIILFLGSIVSAWVSLNNSQVETNTKLQAFEQYYKNSLQEYKSLNEKSILELKRLIEDQKRLNKELITQVTDLERSVTQIYRLTTAKK